MAFPLKALQARRLSCADVIQCAFDLGGQDVRVYEAVNNLGAARTEEIAKILGKDASVVYRSLQRLVLCSVLVKTKRILDEGGYYYAYEAVPKAQVKRKLKACVEDWRKQMLTAIDRL
ncbi:MAG: helix-turn-helix domain-containing protein [Candidatus Thermoplasmatota archaeon]